MSAAPPLHSPPAVPGGMGTGNGPSNGQLNVSARAGGGGGGGSGGGERVFPHISDLQADALFGLSNAGQSITQLLARAEHSVKDATFNLEYRRPDMAFVDYLRAAEIAVEIVPHHRDYIHFIHDQHGLQKLQVLQRRITALAEQYDSIKQIIVHNNSRNGTVPRSQRQNASEGQGVENGSPQLGTHKAKPSVSPKPDKLHARPLSAISGHVPQSMKQNLDDRFAKLRVSGPNTLGSRASLSSPPAASMPSAGDYGGLSGASAPRTKPQGPRRMLLDTELAAAMPKAPSPTYSPARNMQTTGDIAPPRHSVRSLASSRKSSLISNTCAVASVATVETHDSAATFNGAPPRPLPRRKSVHMPKETRITAERLYDYLERFDIMLIDCRSRADFDQGHIFSRNVICVEPVGLCQGMSAEQLADKLILSPEDEQEIFHHRDQYDLVVYYDGDTKSETFLTGPQNEAEMHLKYLHEALYEFNQERQLQRPPIILIGGIDAWIDLVGNAALVTTATQARSKHGRPLQRRSAVRDGQQKLPKLRLRDYNPLDAEEEQRWRDRAQSESVPQASSFGQHEVNEGDSDDADEVTRFPNIDEFNARFPDAGVLAAQAPSRPASTPISSGFEVPKYPSTPDHSVYPHPPPPTRPPPAAPRVSYTGVSDRAVSQSTPVSRTSGQLLPYVPQRYLAQNLRLPKTGIQNFGNTCYMNATLQALSATTPLTIMMLDDQYKRLVQKDNWKGSRGLLPEIYANTVRSLWQGDVDYIKPTTLLTFCGRLNSTFKDPHQQQDAQEFFSFIVDCLHEDFNAVWSKNPLRVLTEQEEAKRERMPAIVVAKTEWGRYVHRENSFLTSLFYGQHSSRLQCSHCNFTSTTYEAWALLQVEIPVTRDAQLQDCLRAHFRDELLDKENQWSCPKCKTPRRAAKKLTMTRAPPFLVVALKRFKSNTRGDQRKLRTAVRFPLTGLNMEEFVLPQPSHQEAQEIARNYGQDALKVEDSLTPPYMYDAYAVVRHLGDSTRSGHYTALVRDKARSCWRQFNDTRCQDFQPENLRPDQALDNEQAYLIFYQRRPVQEPNGK
ncbi:Ubiquitin carboxyl-terminal hydrolase 4 [Cercospora zeina]